MFLGWPAAAHTAKPLATQETIREDHRIRTADNAIVVVGSAPSNAWVGVNSSTDRVYVSNAKDDSV